MYYGESERKLHEIFETARRMAPCVVFIDEIDALGRKRSFLRELDSIESENEGLFVLAATNHPWDVDSALRRPGRLDRMLLVLPPDAPARQAILKSALAERPVSGLDVALLAAELSRQTFNASTCANGSRFDLEGGVPTWK